MGFTNLWCVNDRRLSKIKANWSIHFFSSYTHYLKDECEIFWRSFCEFPNRSEFREDDISHFEWPLLKWLLHISFLFSELFSKMDWNWNSCHWCKIGLCQSGGLGLGLDSICIYFIINQIYMHHWNNCWINVKIWMLLWWKGYNCGWWFPGWPMPAPSGIMDNNYHGTYDAI